MIPRLTRNILISVLVVMLIIVGAVFVSSAQPPGHNLQQSTTDVAIQNAILGYYKKQGATRLETFKVRRIAVASPYALASWNWGDTGGQAALVKKNGVWTILTSGGGQIDKNTLMEKGVPAKYAAPLAATNR